MRARNVPKRYTFDGLHMDSIWTLYGLYMDSIWTLYGLYMDSIWTLYGLYMDAIWTLYGLYMDSIIHMDSIWTLYGLHKGFQWGSFLYGAHLPNDTVSIAFENTVLSLIPKENATVSIGSVLKWRARLHCQ
jgi:hypothetical protein